MSRCPVREQGFCPQRPFLSRARCHEQAGQTVKTAGRRARRLRCVQADRSSNSLDVILDGFYETRIWHRPSMRTSSAARREPPRRNRAECHGPPTCRTATHHSDSGHCLGRLSAASLDLGSSIARICVNIISIIARAVGSFVFWSCCSYIVRRKPSCWRCISPSTGVVPRLAADDSATVCSESRSPLARLTVPAAGSSERRR